MLNVSSAIHKSSRRDGPSATSGFNKEMWRERMKNIKRLFNTTEENEDIDFVRTQEKALVFLKKNAEILKGYKITENCFEKSRSDNTFENLTLKSRVIDESSIKEMNSIIGSNISDINNIGQKNQSIDLTHMQKTINPGDRKNSE
jgi:hypothetical protein